MDQEKKQLTSRKDVSLLVRAFYSKVRKDEMLGPIFNTSIKDWEPHLEKLTDFWEGNLFMYVKSRFDGNPAKAHQNLDDSLQHTLTMEHFGRWINLWLATLDEHFTGDVAELAKTQARKMASFLFLKIFQNRPHAV